ncbi:chromosome partitioning protein, ParB family [Lachnospiraceae bacterium NE2001]|nr:chromosome partitioning protein, ParB family [Lachnospiraceae bacterium NE2001]
MAQKRGLGKGLGTLFSSDETEDSVKKDSKKKVSTTKEQPVIEKEVIKEVIKEVQVPAETKLKINEIEPNRAQPRKDFNEDALLELADSIKKYGIIEPIVVSKKGKSYVIIAGERRWRAARQAGLKEVPVIVREYSDKERMEVALIENLQREDLNPIEEALAYQSLIDEYHLKQDEVAERVSKGRSTITNALRLLSLSDKVKQMLIDDMITTGHARCLLSITDEEVQYKTAMSIFDERLSVRETEQLVKGVNNILAGNEIDDEGKVKPQSEKDTAMEAILAKLEEGLKTTLGSKVTIKSRGKKGKIEIEYVSNDDLERIIHIINTGAAV